MRLCYTALFSVINVIMKNLTPFLYVFVIMKDLTPFLRKLLRKQLEHRFGALPAWAIDKLNSAPELDLETWGEAVLTVPTLDAVFDESKTH